MRFGSRVLMLALTTSLAGAGCLVTSDFDGIVGIRPEGASDGSSGDLDAGDDAPTGGSGACSAESHTFCTTFDDVEEPPVPGWQIVERGTGKVSLETTGAVSEPNAMNMSVSGEAETGAFLLRDVSLGSFTSVKLAFDFRLVDCESQVKNSLTFVYLGVGTGTAYGFVILSSGSLALGSVVGSDNAFYPLEKLIQKDEWTRVAITLTAKTSTELHLNLTVNGETSVDSDAPTGPPKSTLQIELGVQGASAQVGCRVAYDNIALDKE